MFTLTPRRRREAERAALDEARAAAVRAQLVAAARDEAERELAAAADTGRPWWRVGLALAVREWALLAPLLVLAGLHGVGVLAQRAPVPWLVIAVVAAGVGWVWRGRRSVWARIVLPLLVAWVAWTGWQGIAVTDMWLWLVGAAAAVPWWRARWPRPDTAPVDVPVVELDDLPARWRRNLDREGRTLHGAELTGEVGVTEHYDWYTIQVDPGHQSHEDLTAALPKVETGLRTPREMLHFEFPHPGHPKDPAMVQLRHLRVAPSSGTEWLTETCVEDGRVRMAPHTDRDGWWWWRTFTENRMWGGFIAGGTGSGKSRTAESMVLALRRNYTAGGTPIAVFYLDGQNGASSPLLYRHATWSAGRDQADTVVEALDRAKIARQAYNAEHGLPGFTPGHIPPGETEPLTAILAVVDECHLNWPTTAQARRWDSIVRECGKLGIAVVALDQGTGLEAFGGDEMLRSSLLEGNGAAFRISSQTQGHLIPGLPINPKDLPAIPGYGVPIVPDGAPGRPAPFRMPFAPSRSDVERGVTPPPEALILDEAMAASGEAPIDKLTAQALGAPFLQRHARADEQAAARSRFLERMRNGETVDERPDLQAVAPLAPAAVKKPARETIREMLEVAEEPVPRKTMVEATGVTSQAVSLALRTLMEEKAAVQVALGYYWTPAKHAAAETAAS